MKQRVGENMLDAEQTELLMNEVGLFIEQRLNRLAPFHPTVDEVEGTIAAIAARIIEAHKNGEATY